MELVLLVGLCVAIGLTIFGVFRWTGHRGAENRWQITLAQVFVLFTIFLILGAIFRYWYLNEFLDPLAR